MVLRFFFILGGFLGGSKCFLMFFLGFWMVPSVFWVVPGGFLCLWGFKWFQVIFGWFHVVWSGSRWIFVCFGVVPGGFFDVFGNFGVVTGIFWVVPGDFCVFFEVFEWSFGWSLGSLASLSHFEWFQVVFRYFQLIPEWF